MSEKIPNYGEKEQLRAETEKQLKTLVNQFEIFAKRLNPDVNLDRDKENEQGIVPQYKEKIVALLFSSFLEGFKIRGEVILRRIYEG